MGNKSILVPQVDNFEAENSPRVTPPRFQIGYIHDEILRHLDRPSVTRTFTDNGAEVSKTGIPSSAPKYRERPARNAGILFYFRA